MISIAKMDDKEEEVEDGEGMDGEKKLWIVLTNLLRNIGVPEMGNLVSALGKEGNK